MGLEGQANAKHQAWDSQQHPDGGVGVLRRVLTRWGLRVFAGRIDDVGGAAVADVDSAASVEVVLVTVVGPDDEVVVLTTALDIFALSAVDPVGSVLAVEIVPVILAVDPDILAGERNHFGYHKSERATRPPGARAGLRLRAPRTWLKADQAPPPNRHRGPDLTPQARYGLKRSRLKGHEGQQIWSGWGILAYDLDTLAV